MARRPREDSNERQINLLVDLLGQLMSTPAGHTTLLVLAFVALIVGGVWLAMHRTSESQPALVTGPTVRIATWNLHQFSPRPEIDLRKIAQVITDNQFDVVAVQEVKREGQQIDALLNVLGSPWHAAIGPINLDTPTHRAGNNERFAFVYNASHVREIGPARVVPLPKAQSFDRVPYEDTFAAGNFQFTLVTVHLDYTRLEQRAMEVQWLVEMSNDLNSPAAGDANVIILGDFNEQRHRPNLGAFTTQGWQMLIHEPTNLSSTEDFDQILIDPRNTRQWTSHSGVVNYEQIFHYTDPKVATAAISDHRPAWADFGTGTGGP